MRMNRLTTLFNIFPIQGAQLRFECASVDKTSRKLSHLIAQKNEGIYNLSKSNVDPYYIIPVSASNVEIAVAYEYALETDQLRTFFELVETLMMVGVEMEKLRSQIFTHIVPGHTVILEKNKSRIIADEDQWIQSLLQKHIGEKVAIELFYIELLEGVLTPQDVHYLTHQFLNIGSKAQQTIAPQITKTKVPEYIKN